jgi:uncharacterized tellurite resistance protein B-like protein
LFLDDLTNTEKIAFLDLARMMVSADGIITAEEREMLRDVQVEMGLEVAEDLPTLGIDLDGACNSVVSTSTRVKVLLELASFAYVDSDYDERERKFLRGIGEKWQFDEISIIRVEEWASRRVALAREAAEIILEADIFFSERNERGP